MSQPRHLDAGLRVRLRLRSRRASGAHRAPETEHVSDEALEICVPALEKRSGVADLSDDIRALLDSADDTSAPARRRSRGR